MLLTVDAALVHRKPGSPGHLQIQFGGCYRPEHAGELPIYGSRLKIAIELFLKTFLKKLSKKQNRSTRQYCMDNLKECNDFVMMLLLQTKHSFEET